MTVGSFTFTIFKEFPMKLTRPQFFATLLGGVGVAAIAPQLANADSHLNYGPSCAPPACPTPPDLPEDVRTPEQVWQDEQDHNLKYCLGEPYVGIWSRYRYPRGIDGASLEVFGRVKTTLTERGTPFTSHVLGGNEAIAWTNLDGRYRILRVY